MKPIINFAARLGATITLNPNFTVKKDNRYFLLNPNLNKVIRKDFYYAGVYLGKVKNGKFFPSFNLLAVLAKTEANKIIVDRKAAWLFICGRDIFQKGITAVQGSQQKGSHVLVMNEFGECLGFGKIIRTLNAEEKGNEVAVKNISDIGDFLRRET
jgi:ribosome biogenesis protein Nip4